MGNKIMGVSIDDFRKEIIPGNRYTTYIEDERYTKGPYEINVYRILRSCGRLVTRITVSDPYQTEKMTSVKKAIEWIAFRESNPGIGISEDIWQNRYCDHGKGYETTIDGLLWMIQMKNGDENRCLLSNANGEIFRVSCPEEIRKAIFFSKQMVC